MSATTNSATTDAGRPANEEPLAAPTLCHAFQLSAKRFADAPALRTAGGSVEISWGAYAERTRRTAYGLAAAGVKRGDTVAMMLSNRPEAFIVDSAVMHLGAVPFSVYNTSSPEQLEYLLGHSDAILIVTEAALLEPVLAARSHLNRLREVIVVDDDSLGDRSLTELATTPPPDGFDFAASWQAARPEDVATLIYTSGTTGPPKGVQLTHANLMAEWRLVSQLHPLRPQGRVMSYLPMAHLADRVAGHYAGLVSGACVTCVADPRQVVAALPEVRPTMWMAVPRIWEKLHAALVPMLDRTLPPEQRAATAGRVRSDLGLDDVDLLLSGAAPIAVEILEFFADLGLDIYEVWGMTETSASATCSPRNAHRVGTVGRALPGVEVTLADDGELLVRGPIVMGGYRNDSRATAAAIDAQGWMHTGDVGTIDADGYVRIIDRKKELIVNAAGKNMSPANIENAIKSCSPLIAQAIAIGDRRPYNVALLVLDPDAAAHHARQHGLPDASPGALAEDPGVRELIAAAVAEANLRLSRAEQIKRWTVLAEDWLPGGEELTPTMKLKRKPIAEKYAAKIDALYGGSG